MSASEQERAIETDIPERMDRLPWSRWHVRIITALGTSWLLDGLEVTLVGSLSGVLESKHGLSLTDPQVTSAATIYLAGAVCGALFFGHLTDRLGRKKLFLVTLATYSVATICTALSMNFLFFAFCRFFTGLGIGGEYAAINSAVDELIPGKVRGTVDLFVNATFWIGATVGSIAAFVLLGGHGLPLDKSWRYAFGIGGALGLGVLLLRLKVPESPRWLMLRGKEEDANRVVDAIELEVKQSGKQITAPTDKKLKLTTRDHTPFSDIFKNMVGENRTRSFLGLALMVGQSLLLN
jgi:MFS family permease